MNLIDRLYANLPEMFFISREDFGRALEGWTLDTIEVDGEPAFVAMTKGPEFHIDSLGTGHRIPLGEIRRRLAAIVAEHGHATTRTPHDDVKQQRINEMFGAVRTGSDKFDVHYRWEGVACRQ